MELTQEDVKKCLRKAHEIAALMEEQYKLYVLQADRWPRSVDDLHWVTAMYIGNEIPIRTVRVSAATNSTKGSMIAHGGNNYEILLASELSDEARRITQAKELFHILLDEDRYHSMDLYAHVEATAECFRIESSTPRNAVVVEFLAHIAAMEFLFPFKKRLEIHQQQGDKEIDYGLIALNFGIPQAEVEAFLISSNMEELGKIYELMTTHGDAT